MGSEMCIRDRATIVCIGMVGVTAGERTVVRNFLKNKLCKK